MVYPNMVRLTAFIVLIPMALMSCSGGEAEPSSSLLSAIHSNEEATAVLAQLLPEQTDLTKEIVADGEISQAEQEQAISALFECYAEAGVTPSDPAWNGTSYTWEISLNASPEDIELANTRSEDMFECERVHWEYISTAILALTGPTDDEIANMDQQVADCITAKGLDGDLYLELDPSIVGTDEAATCYWEVYGD